MSSPVTLAYCAAHLETRGSMAGPPAPVRLAALAFGAANESAAAATATRCLHQFRRHLRGLDRELSARRAARPRRYAHGRYGGGGDRYAPALRLRSSRPCARHLRG